MCLLVTIGVDAPLRGGPPPDGACGPAEARDFPPELASKRLRYEIVEWHDGRPFCSCVFLETVAPWEGEAAYDRSVPEVEAKFAAFASLRAILREALEVDPAPLLASAWSGEEDRPPEGPLEATPDAFAPARFNFCGREDGSQNRFLYRLTRAAS